MNKKIKYILYGESKQICMFSYETYLSYLSDYFEKVDNVKNADIVIVTFVGDIVKNYKRFHRFIENSDVKVVLLSEEPLFDTRWSDRIIYENNKTFVRNLRGNKEIELHILSYFTSDIFDFDKIPYFLTTNKNIIENYRKQISLLENKNLVNHWLQKKYDVVGLQIKRPEEGKFDFGEIKEGTSLGRLREELIDKFTNDCAVKTKFLGSGYERLKYVTDYTNESSRDSAEWHTTKLNYCNKKSKFLFSIENTICKNYITEKIFDAVSTNSLPIYFQKHKTDFHFVGINLYNKKTNNMRQCYYDLISDIKKHTEKSEDVLHKNIDSMKHFLNYDIEFEIEKRVNKLYDCLKLLID